VTSPAPPVPAGGSASAGARHAAAVATSGRRGAPRPRPAPRSAHQGAPGRSIGAGRQRRREEFARAFPRHARPHLGAGELPLRDRALDRRRSIRPRGLGHRTNGVDHHHARTQRPRDVGDTQRPTRPSFSATASARGSSPPDRRPLGRTGRRARRAAPGTPVRARAAASPGGPRRRRSRRNPPAGRHRHPPGRPRPARRGPPTAAARRRCGTYRGGRVPVPGTLYALVAARPGAPAHPPRAGRRGRTPPGVARLPPSGVSLGRAPGLFLPAAAPRSRATRGTPSASRMAGAPGRPWPGREQQRGTT
jgi:hypothetical protein